MTMAGKPALIRCNIKRKIVRISNIIIFILDYQTTSTPVMTTPLREIQTETSETGKSFKTETVFLN